MKVHSHFLRFLNKQSDFVDSCKYHDFCDSLKHAYTHIRYRYNVSAYQLFLIMYFSLFFLYKFTRTKLMCCSQIEKTSFWCLFSTVSNSLARNNGSFQNAQNETRKKKKTFCTNGTYTSIRLLTDSLLIITGIPTHYCYSRVTCQRHNLIYRPRYHKTSCFLRNAMY